MKAKIGILLLAGLLCARSAMAMDFTPGASDGSLLNAGSVPSSAQVGSPLTIWSSVGGAAAVAANAITANKIQMRGFVIPPGGAVSFTKIYYFLNATDAVNSYDFGIYNAAGTLVAHIGAQTLPSNGVQSATISGGGPVLLTAGKYYYAFTGTAITAVQRFVNAGMSISFYGNDAFGTSTGGALPSTITPPADANVVGMPVFGLAN